MPTDKDCGCIYECNKGIMCMCSSCDACEYNPSKKSKLKSCYMSCIALIKAKWEKLTKSQKR